MSEISNRALEIFFQFPGHVEGGRPVGVGRLSSQGFYLPFLVPSSSPSSPFFPDVG
jgi:hypothetical protein